MHSDAAHMDVAHMSRALRLARRGLGFTAPNPAVGAVLVKSGRIIGEGYHRQAGGPHAEVAAIDNATESVRGATLYCTLEPCCHEGPHKRTPPCTRRIITEGIERVVIAALDPNPQVNGRGVAILRRAGVQVTVGPLADEAAGLNEIFAANVRLARPFVHLKAAQTLDGRVATETGDSRWITDRAARTEAHRLRSLYDAVLVGAGTVRRDDPSLTVRHIDGRNPRRIVLAGRKPLPPHLTVLTDARSSNTLVYRPRGDAAEIDLAWMLQDLLQREIRSVLVEGGSRVLSSFVQWSLWDKVTLFIAPCLLGGGISVVSGLAPERIDEAVDLQGCVFSRVGNGVMVSGYRAPQELFGLGVAADTPVCRGTSAMRRMSDNGDGARAARVLQEAQDVHRNC